MAKKENTFDSIKKEIKQRKFAPVYFLMGNETYFIDQITDLLIETVLGESEKDFNQITLYGADVNAMDIINASRRYPMMSEYQLVIVREAQLVKDIEQLITYVKSPLLSTILIVNYKYKTIDKRKAFALTVDNIGVLYEAIKIPDYKMSSYIVSMLHEESITIDNKASQMLADYLGNDIARLRKEIDKLILLFPEKGTRRITPEMVEENIGISKEYNNFELLRAIISNDVLKANRIIQYFEKDPKDNPLQVTLVVLFNYFSNLLICYYSREKSESSLMAILGLRSAFQVKDYMIGMRRFSGLKVFNLIGEIRMVDARSKGFGNSSVGNGDLLKELLYKIMH